MTDSSNTASAVDQKPVVASSTVVTAPTNSSDIHALCRSKPRIASEQHVNSAVLSRSARHKLTEIERQKYIESMTKCSVDGKFETNDLSSLSSISTTQIESIADLSQILNAFTDHCAKYDLLHIFSLFPVISSDRSLQDKDRWVNDRTINLVQAYDKIDLETVCAGVVFMRQWFDDESLKELDWTNTLLKNFCEPALLPTITAELDRLRGCNRAWTGGPITLKVILSHVINSSEKAIEALPKKIANIKISDTQGEDISALVNRLTYVIKRLEQTKLHKSLNRDLIKMFQTTSNARFNSRFGMLESQVDMELIETPSWESIFRLATKNYYDELDDDSWNVSQDPGSMFNASSERNDDQDTEKVKRPPICQRPNPAYDTKKMVEGNKCWTRKSKKGEWMKWCGKCFWKEGNHAFDGRWTTGDRKHFTHEHKSASERESAHIAAPSETEHENEESPSGESSVAPLSSRLKTFRDAALGPQK